MARRDRHPRLHGAKAHKLGMGIVAMKVIGGGVLGAWPGYVVPGFDKKRLERLPAAAIRYVLQDERVHLLTIRKEVDANARTLSGDATYTLDDRALLAEFCARALDSDAGGLNAASTSACGIRLPKGNPAFCPA